MSLVARLCDDCERSDGGFLLLRDWSVSLRYRPDTTWETGYERYPEPPCDGVAVPEAEVEAGDLGVGAILGGLVQNNGESLMGKRGRTLCACHVGNKKW